MTLKDSSASLLKPPLSERDHILGSADAPIELVEYGDFECPHCTRAALILKEVQGVLGARLRFAYRHFPLSKMHPLALKAAEASEAAAAQGKFWQMHDLMFARSPELEIEQLVQYASALSLDMQRFESELANEMYSARVEEDVSSGVRSGVNGTPTFFINGKRHNGGFDYDSLMVAMARG